MTDKSPDAYRTISEVAEDLDLPQHVLRFWETRFSQIRPLKRSGGRRYYRPADVELLKGIRYLLYGEGYTIKGVQRILKEQGPKAVQSLVQGPGGEGAGVPYLEAAAPSTNGHAAPMSGPGPAEENLEEPEDEAFEAETSGEDDLEPMDATPPARDPSPLIAQPAAPIPLSSSLPDLFGKATTPSPPLPKPQAAPPPNVSFMRGGLTKPAPKVEPQAAAPAVLVRRPPPVPEPPAPRVVPVSEAEAAPPSQVIELQPPRKEALAPEHRRALQSALFELSECRRAIERITATRGR